jgi:hypothetical protein
MKKPGRRPPPDEMMFAPRSRKALPFEFVMDALASLEPTTRPMFGCTAVYVEDKIVLILRDKPAPAVDNGVWVATTREHHESLRGELPSLRSISVLGPGVTGWQSLPSDALTFEEEALRAVALIHAGDPRIGKVPQAKRPRAPARGAAAATKAAKAPARKAAKAKPAKAPARKVASAPRAKAPAGKKRARG